MGICTPNIGTGGYNCHGIHEYADITEMAKIVSLVKRILTTK
jgi:di/tripeptidase